MTGQLVYLNDENFESEIGKGVTLVDFYADWCGPCRMITPIVEELSKEFDGRAKIAKVDIDAAQNTATNFNVTSIPTLIIFKDGAEVKRVVGVRDKKTLSEMISQSL